MYSSKPKLAKSISFAVITFILFLPAAGQAQKSYYFPDADKAEFDEQIPSPSDFLAYDIGTHYTRHDRIVSYFKHLAQLSDKATIQQIGETYEHRPQVVLTVTSQQNQEDLQQIRQRHLSVTEPDKPLAEPSELKSVVALNYSVHGDETSSGEAAMLTAYYLLANKSRETQEILTKGIVHIDPAQNPDGRDRAAHYHNSYKSFPPVADPADAEHNQPWPRGRTNHFLHDLNRDWLAITQRESKNRVAFYHQWYPNIQIDFHEMGTNATYYLEPTQPIRTWNPIIPEYHYKVMSPLIAKYQVDALDNLGALYWTKEVFDNISPIYGSTYPDILGGVGSTFEVGSSRGLVQESNAGEVSFRSTIRKHLHTGIATVRAAVKEKRKLLEYQKDFFRTALEQAAGQPVRAYVFGDEEDPGLTHDFLDLLLQHKLKVYEVNRNIERKESTFDAGTSYVVPTDQKNYRIIHDIFEPNTNFPDSVFYDITGWSIVQGYGIQYDRIESDGFKDFQGERVTGLPTQHGSVAGGKSNYAYLLNWSDYNASPALYNLLDDGIIARVSHKPFEAVTSTGNRQFSYGDIVISVQEQDLSSAELYKKLQAVADRHKVTFYGVSSGFTPTGIDLGSRNIQPVEKPEVAMVIGPGVSSYEVGETWFLLNKHVGLGVTKIRKPQVRNTDLNRYNTIVLVDGNYGDWSKETIKNIKGWVRSGGVLITYEDATQWAIENELSSKKLLKTTEDTSGATPRYNYEERTDRQLAASIPGVILQADIDPSHPIAFGVDDRSQLFLKDNQLFLNASPNPYGTVAKYSEEPLVGGQLNEENLNKIRGTAALLATRQGSGKVILFAENPNFRSYWHTTSRLFLNAIFFGRNLRLPRY